MRFRSFVEFTSDLPTGLIENDGEGPDFLQYGGESVAEALREMLARLGCRLEPLLCLDERGWEFRFRLRKLKLCCRVALIDGYLVIFQDLSARWRVFSTDHPDFIELLVRLNDEMTADGRFHEIGWFAEEEVLSRVEGAKSPIAAFSDQPCMRTRPP
jgi:hypothetical protein